MASGKTTFARALARELGREFIDLDFYIEQRFRQSISQIFETRGEEGFRKLESAMLREVGEFEDVVIACGGGTPCFNENMDYMNARGVTVYLDTPVWRIVERLVANRVRRPLMSAKSESELESAVQCGLAERMEHYRRAQISISGEELEDKRQIDRTVAAFLAQYTSLIS